MLSDRHRHDLLPVRLGVTGRGVAIFLGRLGLCAAYLQGGIVKSLDFGGAVQEARDFGLPAPTAAAVLTIVTEFAGTAMVLSGRGRRTGALWLASFTLAANMIANCWWTLPPGQHRSDMVRAFFEHLGLIGGFLLLAIPPAQQRR